MQKLWVRVVATCLLGVLAGGGHNLCAVQEAGGAPASAPPARPARGRAERELQRLSERLNLTEEQKAKILPILQERNKKLDDLRAKSSLPQGEARAQASEIRKSARQRIDQILTPEQREKQKAMRQGNRPKRSGQAGQPPRSQ